MDWKPHIPWNIFLPHQALYGPSGYLIGSTYMHANMICVHGISNGEPDPGSANIIGYFEKNGPSAKQTQKLSSDIWVNLKSEEFCQTVDCSLEVLSATGSSETCPVVCILFDPVEVNSSYVFIQASYNQYKNVFDKKLDFDVIKQRLKKGSIHELNDNMNKTAICDLGGSILGNAERCQNTTAEKVQETRNVLTVLARNIEQQQTNVQRNVKALYGSPNSLSGWMLGWLLALLLSVPLLLMGSVYLVGHMFNLGVSCVSTLCSSLPKLLQTPSIILHLQTRAIRYKAVLSLNRKDKFNRFILYNCCAQQLVDTVLGISLIWLIVHRGLGSQISSYILDWADDVARELTTLVQWLMGAPAGLKLNAQLTKFLGHFFIYHIYLWTGYLTLLRNVMPSVILFCSCTGVLGVSAQMCLVQDVLSMLTLHIYCFYVYAAKIFHLQVYALRSLWRLFRGKKWNVLRARVDSASYNTDQLFVGTLLFTILLFLLPTTALYYAVFTLLRLMELAVQGILSRIVAFITSTPVFTIVLRLVAPKLVAGSAVFQVPNVPEGRSCLVLNMQTCQVPFHQLTKLTSSMLSAHTASVHTWGQFLSYLATGKLIYPWVDVKAEVDEKKLQ